MGLPCWRCEQCTGYYDESPPRVREQDKCALVAGLSSANRPRCLLSFSGSTRGLRPVQRPRLNGGFHWSEPPLASSPGRKCRSFLDSTGSGPWLFGRPAWQQEGRPRSLQSKALTVLAKPTLFDASEVRISQGLSFCEKRTYLTKMVRVPVLL